MKHRLWTAQEISETTGGKWLFPTPVDWNPKQVSYDVSGNMKGHICVLVHPKSWGKNRQDASVHISRLIKQRAAAIIVQPEHIPALKTISQKELAKLPVCLVNNTRSALRNMAQISRMRFKGKVFAVTGTVGKTTTREMIRHLTALQGGASSTKGNNNNISGVHRTLAYLPRNDAAGVVEMGFGRPLDGIGRSSLITQPDVAILTGVSVAHFDMFTPEMLKKRSGLDLLIKYKSAIFNGLAPGGAAIFNGDQYNANLVAAYALQQTSRVFTYGSSNEFDAFPIKITSNIKYSQAIVSVMGRRYEFVLNVPGRHMVMNALSALLSLSVSGFDVAQAAKDLVEFRAVSGRARVVQTQIKDNISVTVIDDSFNATLASIQSSLDLLNLAKPDGNGRRIAVLGEIGHVGDRELEEHRALAINIVSSKTNLVFTWGPLMREMFESLPKNLRGAHEDHSVEALYDQVFSTLQDGDIIIIKSGRGVNGLGDTRFLKFAEHLISSKDSLAL